MRVPTYPSDLTDDQRAPVEPLIPECPGGRPRKARMRGVMDAVPYVLRTGGPWRALPKDFPPKSTVRGYRDEWQSSGTSEAIHDALREQVRQREGERRTPSAGSLDSPSVPASSGGADRGYGGHEKADGRKRNSVADARGRLRAVAVTAANVGDAEAARAALGRAAERDCPRLRRVWADQKYRNRAPYGWVAERGPYPLAVGRRRTDAKGVVLRPKRWVVERTFARPKRCRRRTVDRERTTRAAESAVRPAMIHLMLERLSPSKPQPKFRYSDAG